MIEFFAQLPKLTNIAPNASTNGIPLAPALDALKLEAIHCLAGKVTLDGAKTRIQGAVLGEPSPGTLFDLWGNGQAAPASLALLPPNAISYSESEFNFGALYEIVMRGVKAILPPGQQGGPAMVDSLAQSRFGMPLPEALGLFSGEFASFQLSPSMDPQKAVYVLGIRKKPETVKLIHTVFSDQVSAEHTEGDTTFMKVSLSGGQGGAGVAQWNFYHLAITPQFILASGRQETLHDLLAKRATGAPTTIPAAYQTARAAYPGKLDGVDYFDFRAVDWPALKDRWVVGSEESRCQASRWQGAKTRLRESSRPVDQRQPASLPQASTLHGRRFVEGCQGNPFRSVAGIAF